MAVLRKGSGERRTFLIYSLERRVAQDRTVAYKDGCYRLLRVKPTRIVP